MVWRDLVWLSVALRGVVCGVLLGGVARCVGSCVEWSGTAWCVSCCGVGWGEWCGVKCRERKWRGVWGAEWGEVIWCGALLVWCGVYSGHDIS